jgi:hypothetical protein
MSVLPSRRLLVAVAALLLAGGGAWWVTHPSALDPVGSRTGLPAQVGQPVLVGVLGYPAEGSVLLRSATPRVRAGSADADVRVVYCTSRSVLGASREPVEQACDRVLPVKGQRLARPTPENGFGQLLLEITAREPGTVVVDGVDIGYSTGLRRGSQSAGQVAQVDAGPAS